MRTIVVNEVSARTTAAVPQRGDDPHAAAGKAFAQVARPVERGVASKAAAIYLLLFPIPVVCFVGALATDIAYSASAAMMSAAFTTSSISPRE